LTRTTTVNRHRRKKPSGGSTSVKTHKRRVEDKKQNIFAGADVISVYTREQAIEDGFQRDVSREAREVGFQAPVTITTGVMEEIEVPESLEGSQDERGRLHDVLFVGSMKFKARRAQLNQQGASQAEMEHDLRIVPFTVRFQDTPHKAHDRKLWLVFNEYEGFTIMTPSEY